MDVHRAVNQDAKVHVLDVRGVAKKHAFTDAIVHVNWDVQLGALTNVLDVLELVRAAHLALAAPVAVPAVSLAEAVPDAADSAEDPASQDAPEVAGHPASRPAHQHVTTPAPVRVLR